MLLDKCLQLIGLSEAIMFRNISILKFCKNNDTILVATALQKNIYDSLLPKLNKKTKVVKITEDSIDELIVELSNIIEKQNGYKTPNINNSKDFNNIFKDIVSKKKIIVDDSFYSFFIRMLVTNINSLMQQNCTLKEKLNEYRLTENDENLTMDEIKEFIEEKLDNKN